MLEHEKYAAPLLTATMSPLFRKWLTTWQHKLRPDFDADEERPARPPRDEERDD